VLFAQVLPPIMLGSLTAILLSGRLNWVGKRKPHLTGEGACNPVSERNCYPARRKPPPPPWSQPRLPPPASAQLRSICSA
jgi:hypothetical protein